VIRRLNFTGRRRIERSRVRVRLLPGEGGPSSFHAAIDLEGLGLPGEAAVYLEAYRGPRLQRFDWGTVARIQPAEQRDLVEMDPRAVPLFRLKVVDRTGALGRILASVDRVVPRRPEEGGEEDLCLLPVEFVDLGRRIWRLDLSDDWPVLQVNEAVEAMREVARSDADFLGLVYPEVVERVLGEILLERDHDDLADEEDWPALWIRFVRSAGGAGPPPRGAGERARADRLRWIEEAVEGFCAANATLGRYRQAHGEGG